MIASTGKSRRASMSGRACGTPVYRGGDSMLWRWDNLLLCGLGSAVAHAELPCLEA